MPAVIDDEMVEQIRRGMEEAERQARLSAVHLAGVGRDAQLVMPRLADPAYTLVPDYDWRRAEREARRAAEALRADPTQYEQTHRRAMAEAEQVALGWPWERRRRPVAAPAPPAPAEEPTASGLSVIRTAIIVPGRGRPRRWRTTDEFLADIWDSVLAEPWRVQWLCDHTGDRAHATLAAWLRTKVRTMFRWLAVAGLDLDAIRARRVPRPGGR